LSSPFAVIVPLVPVNLREGEQEGSLECVTFVFFTIETVLQIETGPGHSGVLKPWLGWIDGRHFGQVSNRLLSTLAKRRKDASRLAL
jgi:hypothetical protein